MDIKSQIAKYAPVKIEVDSKLLDAGQRKLVDALVEAARCMAEIYLRQVWDGNVALKEKLAADAGKDPDAYDYFKINAGPFDRLENNRPFIDGVGKKPAGAAFYPSDITKQEFESWIKKHPQDKGPFENEFTVIRRRDGALKAIPYSEEYREWLTAAAGHLRRVASLADNASLKKYLASRADAFLSNDYFQSDVDWVRLEGHDIDVVIGPYEVYEDGLFGYKAAFEAVITRVDPFESERLSRVVKFLPGLEKRLPVPDEHKGLGRNLTSPIIVAHEIYTAGEANRGIQTLALNLPNDERVRQKEGSKKVMFKNVAHAKFDKILKPIAKLMMKPSDAGDIEFEAFFAHTLLHEISHGIGPGEIKKGGEATTVGRELKELYTVIEECKADTLGIFNNVYLVEKGLYPKDFCRSLWPTYLAGMFRSMRFGISQAHGGSNAIQFNYILDKGGFTYDKSAGLFGVNEAKIEKTVRDLARDLLTIQATGDYTAAKKFVEKYCVMRPELAAAILRLISVPVDIRPTFAYA